MRQPAPDGPFRRYERAATVLTSNKGFGEWGQILGDEVMAAALLDRVLHRCHIVSIRAESMEESMCQVASSLPSRQGRMRLGQRRTRVPDPTTPELLEAWGNLSTGRALNRQALVFYVFLRGLPTALTVSLACLNALPNQTGIDRNGANLTDRLSDYTGVPRAAYTRGAKFVRWS